MPESKRFTLDLLKSLCTKSVDEEVRAFDDPEAEHIQNTGIERNGGLSAIYEVEAAHTAGAGSYFATRRNKLLSTHLSGSIRDVKIDGRSIGQVSAYGVEARRVLAGVDDTVLSSQAGYTVTAKLVGAVLTLSNVAIATGVAAASRTITFTILSGLTGYTSLTIVRKATQQYSDSDWEFLLRIGEQVLLLKENDATYARIRFSNTTKYLITAVARYKTFVVFGTNEGKVFSVDTNGRYRYPDGSGNGTGPYSAGCLASGSIVAFAWNTATDVLFVGGNLSAAGIVASFDGSGWRNADGSGTGSGPYHASVLGPATEYLYAAVAYGNGAVFAGQAGRLSSWDGSAWKLYDGTGTGTGPYDNGAVIGASSILALAVSSAVLVAAGASGRLGSFDGTNWKTYLGVGAGTGPYNNATVIGAVPIYALLYFGSILVVAGESGRVGNFASAAWTTYLGGGAAVQPYNNGTVIGTFTISSLATYGTQVLCLGTTGTPPGGARLGSWESAGGWKNYDGTGAGGGIYNWTLKSFTFGTANQLAVYNHVFCCGGEMSIAVYNTDAAEWEKIYAGVQVPACHFRDTISGTGYPQVWTYRDPAGLPLYFVFAIVDQVSSFDGVAWKYWDATGTGSGPYYNGPLGAGIIIYAMEQYLTHLIVAGANGQLSSWDGTNWKLSDGTGTGTGPYANGVVIGGAIVNALGVYTYTTSTFLIVGAGTGAGAGRLGSWDGALWHNYDGTGGGSGPYNNATIVGATGINAIFQYKTRLIVIGGDIQCRVANYNGTSWTTYAGAGAGEQPYNNDTTIGTDKAWCGLVYRGHVIVAGAATGRLGSFDGTNWKNYDGTGTGLGPYATSGTFGSDAVRCLAVAGPFLYAITINNGVASFDGTAWRTVSGSGTGTGGWIRFTATYSTTITGVAHWNGAVVFTPTRCPMQIQYASVCLGPQPMVNRQFRLQETRLAHLFAWKLENDNYLLGIAGNAENRFYLIDTSGYSQAVLARYVVMQTQSSKTRALLYGGPVWYLTRLEAVGIVGYYDFGSSFSNIVRYPAFGDTIAVAEVALVGIGSVDIAYTKLGVANQSWGVYSPGFVAEETSLLSIIQSGTPTAVGAYGKLTNSLGLPAAVEFRMLWTGTSQSTLSAAVVSGLDDNLGILLSGVGEVDDGFTPNTLGTVILYRSAGKLVIVSIGTSSPAGTMQRVDDRLYKINTIHPLNLYDDEREALNIASSDFNGRALWFNTAAPAVTSQKFASVIYTEFASGIDVGDKLVKMTVLDYQAYRIIGFRLPLVATVAPEYGVDVYIEDLYYRTTLADGSELTDPAKVDSLYLTSTELPIPMGWTYGETVAVGDAVTSFLADDRDGFLIGNSIPGQQSVFQLFGQKYIFDGFYISVLLFDGTAFSKRERLAPAAGLRFIGVSPVTAFFFSDFDNSMFTFDGGRTLQKGIRFTGEPLIIRGLWSSRDNTLLLETSDRFLWIRDLIITRNLKKAAQTSLILADTLFGIVILNDSYRWHYHWLYEAGATVVPFTWQSAYFGIPGNQKMVLSEWVVNLFDVSKAQAVITFTCRAFDTERIAINTRTVTIKPTDWIGVGFQRVRIRPPIAKCLASSIQIDTTSHVLLQEVVAEMTEEAKGLTPASRSV